MPSRSWSNVCPTINSFFSPFLLIWKVNFSQVQNEKNSLFFCCSIDSAQFHTEYEENKMIAWVPFKVCFKKWLLFFHSVFVKRHEIWTTRMRKIHTRHKSNSIRSGYLRGCLLSGCSASNDNIVHPVIYEVIIVVTINSRCGIISSLVQLAVRNRVCPNSTIIKITTKSTLKHT